MFLIILLAYYLLLLLISFAAGRRGGSSPGAFFLGNRRSPWVVVAIGMIGSSVSGVSFVSVPGMVRALDFTYMQTVLGFFFGYVVIAHVLLPLYYRLNLTSIYSYLGLRFGSSAHRTGAGFFLLSKLVGAAVRLYIVALILQSLMLDRYGVPFWLTACGLVLMIWLYTFRSGIRTIVWTDTLQTVCMLAALVLIIAEVMKALQIGVGDVPAAVSASGHARMFVFDDWHSRQYFWKQFLSGVFIPIVMTGLDQDMMQKNLSCRTLRQSQQNMYCYGLSFVPVNGLFLVLGALLLVCAGQQGISLPAQGDQILPLMATSYLGQAAAVFFALGMVAAAFSSADSALTALTTSFVVDILRPDPGDERRVQRQSRVVHGLMAVLFAVVMIAFNSLNNTSAIDAVYTIVSYTYGPLLGLFAFGLFTKRGIDGRWVPLVCVAAPVLCHLLSRLALSRWGYAFGYELLILNGMLTFAGLWLSGLTRRGKAAAQAARSADTTASNPSNPLP